jgi:hypothetical protein
MVTALKTRRNPREITCSRDKVARSVHKTLGRMIIAALKCTLLTVVFIGKDKTKWGKANSFTHIRRRWQNNLITDEILDNTVQNTNNYIFILPKFSRENDLKINRQSWDTSFHLSSVRSWSASGWQKESGRIMGYWRRQNWTISLSDESEMLQVPYQMHSWINQSCIHKIELRPQTTVVSIKFLFFSRNLEWISLRSCYGRNRRRVKEIVELYIYSTSGPSCPVLGRTLPFITRSCCSVYPWIKHPKVTYWFTADLPLCS